MEKIEISQRAKLQLHILQLKAEKASSEDILNQSIDELKQLIFVPTLIKNKCNNESHDDKRSLLNLSKMVVSKSTSYILEQKFGKKQPFYDFLTSMLVDVFSTPFVCQKISKLFAGTNDQVINE